MKEDNLLSRREWLRRGIKTAAGLGLGALALSAAGDFSPFISKAQLSNLSADSLNFAAAEPCVLTCTSTLGPCYFNTGLVRRDITEGKPGLPTRLGFRIVNADTCEPIPNASIDIWHTDNNGVYSAPISTFCNGNAPTPPTQKFGRGSNPPDAGGGAFLENGRSLGFAD